MPERAAGALERLAQVARASGTDWGLGTEAHSRALLGISSLNELERALRGEPISGP